MMLISTTDGLKRKACGVAPQRSGRASAAVAALDASPDPFAGRAVSAPDRAVAVQVSASQDGYMG
ncbi:MAG TPA: hypothetical protein VFR11_13700 [Micromonosporaceae bacterium]|nr:hypothetical protein [Micromonosporaceae bacterium]